MFFVAFNAPCLLGVEIPFRLVKGKSTGICCIVSYMLNVPKPIRNCRAKYKYGVVEP